MNIKKVIRSLAESASLCSKESEVYAKFGDPYSAASMASASLTLTYIATAIKAGLESTDQAQTQDLEQQ